MTAVEPVSSAVSAATDWYGVDFRGGRERSHRWRRLLWSLIYPQRGQRILPTVSGTLLITVALGIGMAAYNTSSNILFIALSLLLACLVFSGVLSWFNLKGVTWRLRLTPPLRVGKEHAIMLELRNRKRVLPTYGLWFDFKATGLAKSVRSTLGGRLDPLGETKLEWTLRPEKRGVLTVELVAVGSLFPFGFLRKVIGSELRREVLVWPAPVEYRRFPLVSWRQPGLGEQKAAAGQGGDLLALRPYASGDSQRTVHWKASARLRRLMVRQFATEMQAGFSLWVQTSAETWTRPEQFELLCSFAATLAEDLFRAGRLTSVAFNDESSSPVRSVRDLERFLDRLALAETVDLSYQPSTSAGSGRRFNLMTFAPDGARGVIAHVDGKPAAAT
ncbi:MAG TPA: DUF58 domain-containing protein [Rariglobus sp.]|jgi:uncharacterized protein (DUF58 family)|nr:DUF58 domain-containing protein [Rariglobus sp.]